MKKQAALIQAQEQCKLEFAREMLELSACLEAIDAATPHSEVEPEWWLRMMEMHRMALTYARQYGG